MPAGQQVRPENRSAGTAASSTASSASGWSGGGGCGSRRRRDDTQARCQPPERGARVAAPRLGRRGLIRRDRALPALQPLPPHTAAGRRQIRPAGVRRPQGAHLRAGRGDAAPAPAPLGWPSRGNSAASARWMRKTRRSLPRRRSGGGMALAVLVDCIDVLKSRIQSHRVDLEENSA